MKNPAALIGFVLMLALATLACIVAGPGDTNRLNNLAYWACVTATPVPTEVFLAGTVPPPTPLSTETPMPTGEPIWGYTTPVPTETPYYRTGTFYESQKVYVNDIEFELRGYTVQAAPQPDLAHLYLHFTVANRHEDGDVVPISQLIFVREVTAPDGSERVGRWTNSNHVLLAGGYPVIEETEQVPMDKWEARQYTLGLVIPQGRVDTVGLATDWERPSEGGVPIWFYLDSDPVICPYGSAVDPPPPTPRLIGDVYGGVGSGPGSAIWPAAGALIDGFGCRPSITGIISPICPPGYEFHAGIDIANNTGTLVVAPIAGTVTYAGAAISGPDCSGLGGSHPPHLGYGNYVRIDGTNGQVHILGHLQSALVSPGQAVSAGQPVGTMNSTGCSTGSHLHWGCYLAGFPVDPASC
jgi:hypothetical protein